MNAEAEYRLNYFDRTPEPVTVHTGTSLTQDYRLYAEGGLFKKGSLDTMLGVTLNDKYRDGDMDFQNKTRFDYGRWLKLETLIRNDTDEQIFFTGTNDPQSPIHTSTERYYGRLALDNISSVEYTLENIERNDLLLRTVTGEKTKTQTVKYRRASGPVKFNAQFREHEFDDLLGTRSDIKTKDIRMDARYRPKKTVTLTAYYDYKNDSDTTNITELTSHSTRVELSLKPIKTLRIRNRVNVRSDENTDTREEILKKEYELIANYNPIKPVGIEAAYGIEDADKTLPSSEDVSSTMNEYRLKLKLTPRTGILVQSRYEVSDKNSSSVTENLRDTKKAVDLTLEPTKELRLSSTYTNTILENTFNQEIESDSTVIGTSMQYRPGRKFSWFLQANTARTNNPTTDSFSQTDTISSTVNIYPYSFVDVYFRTSGQRNKGTSIGASAEKLLNSIEFDFRLLDNLTMTAEYETINSWGSGASNENLFDVSIFYHLNKFDFSFRCQKRIVSGVNALDKLALQSDMKYKISKNMIFSLEFALIDYDDRIIIANGYDSVTAEGILSLRF